MAEVVVDFNPAESAFAKNLYDNREKNDENKRYLAKGVNTEDIFLKEAETLLNKTDDYPLVVALAIGPLNVLVVNYYKSVCNFIPKGYKINTKAFLEDFETFLKEDIQKTKLSTTKMNPYVKGITRYLASATNGILEQNYGNVFEKDHTEEF